MVVSAVLVIGICVIPYLWRIQAADNLNARTIIELTGKGIDPIAARCSVADPSDHICIVYVASKKETPVPSDSTPAKTK